MPGPYRRIDEPNVNQFVVTQPPAKAKKKAESETGEATAAVGDTTHPAKKATAKKSTAKKG